MKKSLLYLFLIIVIANLFVMLSGVEASAQQTKVDSLNKLLQTAKYDTTRLKLYFELIDACDFKENLKYAEPALKLTDILLTKVKNKNEKTKLLKQKAALYASCGVYYMYSSDTSRINEYANKSISLYIEIKDSVNIVNALENVIYYYYKIGNYSRALEYYNKGLAIAKEMNSQTVSASLLFSMGNMYNDQGDNVQALENYKKSLALFYNLKDSIVITEVLLFSGDIYGELNNIPKALESFGKAKEIYEKMKDNDGVIRVYDRIGRMYKIKNDLTKSLENYQKALSISREIKNDRWNISLYCQIGEIFMEKNDLKKAIEYQSIGLNLAKKVKDESMIILSYQYLTYTLMKSNNFKEAKTYNDSIIFFFANKLMAIRDLIEAHLFASQIDSAMGNGNGAYEHYKKYITLRDKLKSEEVRKAATKEKYQNEYDNQKAIAKAEQDKKDIKTEEEKQRQNIVIWSVVAGLLLVLVFAGFIFRSLRVTRKQKNIIEKQKQLVDEKNLQLNQQNEEITTQRDEIEAQRDEITAQRDTVTTQKEHIEEIHKEVTDSINYAKRIQQAKLPKMEDIHSCLPQSFILFKPKDIVSGDFYFFHKFPLSFEEGRGEVVILAAVDCTGHGVPGAFMSMIGSERLEDAVSQNTDTSEILKQLNIGIKTSLRQSESEESTRDGMDIALCSVEFPSPLERDGRVRLKYAGANRPLWIIRKGQTEIEETKATKKAIGGLTEDNEHFETHNLILQKNDTFYIFSDGYADQFNADDKKLMTKKLKEILLSIQNKSMKEQREYLNSFIENWKGNTEQTDDVLVIGIRV